MVAKWRPVSISSQVAVTGGWSTKSHTLECKTIHTADGATTFVKVRKDTEWLMKLAVGSTAHSGALERVKVFEELRAALAKNGSAVAEDVVAEPAPAAVDADDPMAALDDVDAMADQCQKPKRKRAYTSVRAKDKVSKIEMPALERTKFPECEQKRTVQVYAAGTTAMWISSEDVEWLVQWVADEYGTGGVAMIDEEADELEPNCEAPGVHIRWNFDDGYDAIGVDGPWKGNRTKSIVSKMTQEKWDVVDAIHHYAVTFAGASRDDLKRATWHHLEHSLKTALQQAA